MGVKQSEFISKMMKITELMFPMIKIENDKNKLVIKTKELPVSINNFITFLRLP